MTQTIGIMLDQRTLLQATSGVPTYENIELYEEFASMYGLQPLFFCIEDISLQNNTVNALVKEDNTYIRINFPIPKVIHNRSMVFQKDKIEIIKELINKRVHIYNTKTRYKKNDIYQILSEDLRMRPFLPKTAILTKQNVSLFIKKFPITFVKPVSDSVGRGIIKIVRKNFFQVQIFYTRDKKVRSLKCSIQKLWYKIKLMTRSRQCIIQQGINLAKTDGNPFDVRVSVQKNDKGKWQVTGMTTKVAKKGHYLTNVAQGGQAISLEAALHKMNNVVPDHIRKRLSEVALLATSILDLHLFGLADLGYDIGFDDTGHPYIIELNGRDQRYSFLLAGDVDSWRNTFKNPIGYGKFLYKEETKDFHVWPEALPFIPELPIVADPIENTKINNESLLPVIWAPFRFSKKDHDH